MLAAMPARLQLDNIVKRYGEVAANDGVSLGVEPGEIHAVLGENGAGKSTLMKIAYGAVRPDAGQMLWNGRPVAPRSPQEARGLGIAMVFQHFSLFDSLTVAENVWLGLDAKTSPSLRALERRIDEVAARYGLDVQPERPVHGLSVGERQRVEILRALLAEPRLLILDEPTSVLTPQAVQSLFATLRRLASEGCSILYISHKLDEIQSLCHRCTVMRAGRVTGVVDPRQETAAALSRLMIGAEPPAVVHRAGRPGDVALAVRGLSLPRRERFGVDLHAVDLELHAGEIVGIAGISGNGQQELLAALSGEDRRAPADSIVLLGRPVGRSGPRERRAQGLRCVPEERLGRGAVPALSLADNALLTHEGAPAVRSGWIRPAAVRALAADIVARYGVKTASVAAPARSLSGGNLQKFLVGREMQGDPRVLVAAQPTWGVDVGAAANIRNALLARRDAGCAVLVVSEELEELFQIADRLGVMAKGRLSPLLPAAALPAERIGRWMSGLWNDAGEADHAA
jgi:ABC-type uncharacterized transport system ATPase subunit